MVDSTYTKPRGRLSGYHMTTIISFDDVFGSWCRWTATCGAADAMSAGSGR